MKREDGRTKALKWFLAFISTDIEHLADREVAELKEAASNHFRPRLLLQSAGRIDFHGWHPGASLWLPRALSGCGDWRTILIEVQTELRNFLHRDFLAGEPSSFSGLHDDSIRICAVFGVSAGVGQFEILPKVEQPGLDVLKACARVSLASLLSGVKQAAVQRCKECKAFFLVTIRRRRVYCSKRCANRATAREFREKDYEGFLKRQRELTRLRRRKSAAERSEGAAAEVKVNRRKKQSNANKLCTCGENLDKAKRSQRVKYWVAYRIGKRQRFEYAGASVEAARAAEGKRIAQKKEGRILEMLPDSKVTFSNLAEWYLDRESAKALASYPIIKMKLKKFNRHLGDRRVSSITAADLKDYQAKLKKAGAIPATVDQDLGKVKAMVYAAFESGKVGVDAFRAFRSIKKTLVKGSDVRDRILSVHEYRALIAAAPEHLKGVIAMGYHTGMRRGEILGLTWDRVDLVGRWIHLDARHTKDQEPRRVPINAELLEMLKTIPARVAEIVADRHVFKYQDAPFTDMRDALGEACRKAGIVYGRFEREGFIFHDLRHTFTTNMRRAGVPEREIMAITGHSSRSTFDRYNTVDQTDLRRAIERLEMFSASVDQNVDHAQNEDPAEAGSRDTTT